MIVEMAGGNHMINLIFDADMLCFRASSSCEHEVMNPTPKGGGLEM